MRRSKVLVTGSNGFVGRHFSKRLLDAGHEVTGIDSLVAGLAFDEWMFKPREPADWLFQQCDVRDWFKAADPSAFDLIIHCAAIVGGRLKIDGDPLAVATDLSIDAEFFNWVVRAKNKPKIIYFSSSAVYPLERQRQECHCDLYEGLVNFFGRSVDIPDQTYGWAKLNGEYLAKFAVENYGADVIVYRPFGGYGEDQSFDYPFPSIIHRIVTGENPVTVWGSGDQLRDFIHIEDIVDAVLATMNQLKSGEVLNLGTGMGLSFRELASIASDTLGIPVNIVNDATKPEGVFARVAGTAKLKRYWQHPDPMERLKEGIKKVAAALLTKQ